MARYDTDIDMANPNSSHAQIAQLIGHHKTVLDVGCATGYLARQLNAADCRVYGIDNDAEAAQRAEKDLVELVIADLEKGKLTDHFKPGHFDAVVFGDVLEHIVDPGRVLRDAIRLLNDSGVIIVSIPNVAHGSVRLALLQGRWRYTETGLLDNTHVRFFTREGVFDLLEGAGLEVEEMRSTVFDPLGADVEVEPRQIPADVIEWVRDQPDSLTYQFIASARLVAPGMPRRPRPDVVPALPDEHVRRHDEYAVEVSIARQAQLDAQSREATALLRAERAQARLRRAHKRLSKSRRRMKRAEARAARLETRLQRLRRETARERRELLSSRTWRLGRAVTWPGRLIRKGRGHRD